MSIILRLILAFFIGSVVTNTLAGRQHGLDALQWIFPLEAAEDSRHPIGAFATYTTGPDNEERAYRPDTVLNAQHILALEPMEQLNLSRLVGRESIQGKTISSADKGTVVFHPDGIKSGLAEVSEFSGITPLALACALGDLKRVEAMLKQLPQNGADLNDKRYWTDGFRQPYTLVEVTLSGKFGIFSTAVDKFMVGTFEDRIQILELLREHGASFLKGPSGSLSDGYYTNPPLHAIEADGHPFFSEDEIQSLQFAALRLGADITEESSSANNRPNTCEGTRFSQRLLGQYQEWRRENKPAWLHQTTQQIIHREMQHQTQALNTMIENLEQQMTFFDQAAVDGLKAPLREAIGKIEKEIENLVNGDKR